MSINESIIVAKFAQAVSLYEQMVHSANETERYKQELMLLLHLSPEEREVFKELLEKAANTQAPKEGGDHGEVTE